MKEKIFVIGGGQMGSQIATLAAMAGYKTNIYDENKENLEYRYKFVEENIKNLIDKKIYSEDKLVSYKENLDLNYSLEDVIEGKTFVIEAVVERFDVKLEIFKQISKSMNQEVVMATNSSFIQASEISKHCDHPERFINMHFFYPPIRMDLIEISYPSNVSKEVLERTKTVSENMGRSVVVLKKETPGFIVNRMLAALVDEAYELYDEGIADFEDIDLAIKKGLNHPLGPFELSDYSGLDIHYYAKLKKFEESGDPKDEPKKFLEEIYKESDEKINAKPKILVKEEDLIVGFLTETNQFIMINPPLQELDLSEDLDIIEENNYILSDKISLLSKKRDVERERKIKNIRLEAKFFNAFRNLIRILLSKSENRELNKELYNLVNNKELMYIDKFRKVNELITEIVTDYVDFVEYDEVQLDSLNEIATCLLQSEEKCKDTISCDFASGQCIFLIPKINLVNHGDNEITYFSKISDELVRFNRIRRFMFEEKAFLSFSKVNYNLNFNEILILQSLLTQEYFSNLKSVSSTSGSIFNTYDNSNPNLSVKYGYTKNIAQSSEDRDISKKTLTPSIKLKLKSDKSLEKELSDTLEEPIEKKLEVIPERDSELQVTLPETKKSEEKEVLKDFEIDELEGEREIEVEKPKSKEDIDLDIEALVERESKKTVESPKEVPKINCLKNIKQITSKWKSVIKKGITYINYELLNPYCSFQIIIDILKDKDIDESFDSLKIVLSTEYEKYESYRLNIGNIWKTEGKEIFAEKLLMGEADLETIIMSSDYYLTNIDYYLLSEVYELPIIFLSTAKFKETNKNFLIMNKSVDKNYYILIVPPIKVNEITQYKILNKGENVLLNLDMINIPLQTDLVIGSSFDVSVYIKKNDKKSKKFNVILEKPNKKVDLKKPEEELKLKKDSKEETLRERLEEQELLKALETLNISEVKKGKSL